MTTTPIMIADSPIAEAIGPAILIAHGLRGDQAAKRTVALALPSDIVIESSIDDFGDSLRALAEKVTGQSVIDVVHFVDPDEVDISAVSSAAGACQEGSAELPAIHLRQWVVALVGEDWDDDELALLSLAGGSSPCTGVLIASRSSEARGLLTARDEVAMASDLAYALVSTDLAGAFTSVPAFTAGATTVMYRRRLIAAALAAYHGGIFLDDPLLAPLRSIQPYGAMGRQWASIAGLGSERHREAMSRGALGGSALSELAVSDETFTKTPYEVLSDALQSYFEHLAAGMLNRVKAQVDRNLADHVKETMAALDAEAASKLRESKNFEAAGDFLANVEAGLAELTEDLVVRISDAEHRLPDKQDRIRMELERAIRKLPYPAAIAAHAGGFAALGILLFLIIQKPMGWPAKATPAGLGLGAAFGLILYASYRWGVWRIARLRRRFLREVEIRLQAEAELHVLRTMLDEVASLRAFTGVGADGLLTRLDALRDQVRDLRARYTQRVADREWGPLYATAYSIFLPDTSDVSTEDLAKQFRLPPEHTLHDAILHAILPRTELAPIDVDAADELIVDAMTTQVENSLWPNLVALLTDSPVSHDRVSTVLGTPVSPLVRRSHFMPKSDEVRRFLFIRSARGVDAAALLPDSVDYDGERAGQDADTIQLVALRDARPTPKEDDGAIS